jgi:ATP-dependent helicase YprA (DUF1998 family)
MTHTVDLTEEQARFLASLLVRHNVTTAAFLRSRAGASLSDCESQSLYAEISLGAMLLGRLPHRPALRLFDQHPEAVQ